MSCQGARVNFMTTGNETFDKFLGGGLVHSSLNLFERSGPSSRILDPILTKSIVSAALTNKNKVLIVNFNSEVKCQAQDILSSLPACRQIKSDALYKDIRGSSTASKIKIAWRYTERGLSSPSDVSHRTNQIDFCLSLLKETSPDSLGELQVINVERSELVHCVMSRLDDEIKRPRKSSDTNLIVIIKDILSPFSPTRDESPCRGKARLLEILYGLRCIARTIDCGAIVVNFDTHMVMDYQSIEKKLYSITDSVISFYSYETGENRQTGYKDIDGTLLYTKVPKINSHGFHFQRNISDWGYRLTKNHRYFVIDELSLPPSAEDESGAKSSTDVIKIHNASRFLERSSPLEEFRQVARDILPKRLS